MIVFYTEASGEIGLGHLMECISLAEFLSQRDDRADILFYLKPDFLAEDFLRQKKWNFKIVPDKDIFQLELAKDKPIICVCNFKKIPLDIQEVPFLLDIETIVIDELGEKEILADMLINFSPIKSRHHYTFVRKEPQKLFGLQYFILKKAFQALKTENKASQNNSIIISMGGFDRSASTLTIIEGLRNLKAVEKKVIMGPGFPHREELQKKIDHLDSSYKVYFSPENIAELLFESDIAFSAGGDFLLEAASLGIPSITLWEDDHECSQANWLEDQGVTINLGRGIDQKPTEIEKVTMDLLNTKNRMEEMSHRGLSLIDGKGISRIGEAIFDHFSILQDENVLTRHK